MSVDLQKLAKARIRPFPFLPDPRKSETLMADIAQPALVTDILSGEDGPYDTGYPRWSPKYDYMMDFAGDTPEHRIWLERMRKAQSNTRMAWVW